MGDFSLLQRPTVTVRLQISQGGLGWVLPLCRQHSLFSGLNAVSVPACPLCTLISCSIEFMQGRKKETRARKELLSAKAAPGESQCCQLGLVSGKWGPKGCPRRYCTEEAVREPGDVRVPPGAPLLLQPDARMNHGTSISFTISGLSKVFQVKSLA